ncbi:MAG TPA: M67 family metallopeptidase [Blastocatellia bacterium]|nr:M67 family metallopeptidase [Blastocatellia bacterium]
MNVPHCAQAYAEERRHASEGSSWLVFAVVQFDRYNAMGIQADATTIRITQSVRLFIEEHARRTSPAECCGVLSGANGVITDTHPLRNGADNPETRYFATPEELFAAMRRIREAGQSLLGVYHSHPRTPAYPSSSDVEMAFYPEAVYFIISLEPNIELRAFKIEDARIENVEIVISP